MSKKKYIKNILYIIKPIWEVSPAYVIFSALYTLENIPRRLLDVLIVKYIVDAAILGHDFRIIIITGICLLSIELFLVAVKQIFICWYKTPKENEIRESIKQRLFDKIKKFDIENYDDKDFYDKYTLAFNTADDTAFRVFDAIIKLLGATIAAVTLTSYIMVLNPLVIVVVLVSSVISLISNFVLNKCKMSYKKEKVLCERKINYVSGIYSARQNAADIRMGTITQLLDGFFHKAYQEKIDIEKKYGKKFAILNIIFESPLNISDIFMWLYIAHQIMIGVLGAGDFMSLSNAAWSLSQQIRNVFHVLPKFHEYSLDIENILVLDSYHSKLESSLDLPIDRQDSFQICVQKLSFSYPAIGNDQIISKITFSINSGEKIALVGQNGSGKSTIVKLILRFYNPSEGVICINGHPYSEYNLNDLRSLFSVVFQEFQYYSFSIAENVLLRKPQDERDLKKVDLALKEVGLYDKIHQNPLGANAPLTKLFDDNGIVLSGGELQKLVIARAIIQDTPIIIMDEPSSSLDPLAEREIADLLAKVGKDKIVFIISHRLSLTKDCDKIIVISQGEIAEQGSHEELVVAGGKYAQLWEAQSKDYKE